MKFNGYSFPHPVLGLGDDVGGNASVVKIDNDETTDKNSYILTVEYELNNEDLGKLFADKKAQFLCEVSCTGTVYRKCYTCDTTLQKINIPKDGVREKVELLFLLVSAEPIPNYTNSQVHPDFSGYKFDIDKGDVLAYLGESSFYAGIAYEKLKAVSSFMEIIKGENDHGDFNIILESPKIQVQLSQQDYEKYSDRRIGKSYEYATVFHSAVVLPTLIHALYQLKLDDDVKEYSWAKIIEFRLENEKDLNVISFEEKNIPKIAQIFLGMPIERLLEDLFNRVTSNSDEEE